MCYEEDSCDETFTIFSSTEFNMETCSFKYDFLDPGELIGKFMLKWFHKKNFVLG